MAARHDLIGRSEELARISSALESGTSVLLVGEPGIGKTSLLLQYADRPSTICVFGSGELPLSAFASVGDREWQLPTAGAVTAALFRTLIVQGTRLVVVDDAHVLDAASAGLVLQLARSGTAVLAAARAGWSIPRALQATLHLSGETIRVSELPADSVRMLMEQQLAAPVSLAFATAVAAKTRGNPLFVREVVGRTRAAGGAVLRRGVWLLKGSIPVLEVADLLQERVDQLPSRVRFVLELVSVAGDLPVHQLLDAAGESAVDQAEAEGVVRVSGGTARPGHPLLRDAAVAAVPAGRRGRVHETLLRVSQAAAVSPATAARRTQWRLDGGLDVGVDDLLDAAEFVVSSSAALSERLGQAAADRLVRPEQSLRLAALWVKLGNAARAERELEALPPEFQVLATGLRGWAQWLVKDRPTVALELLDRGVQRFGPVPMLQAQRASALWRLGRSADAIALARSVAGDDSAPDDARGLAAATLLSVAGAALEPARVADVGALDAFVLAGSGRLLGEGRTTSEMISGRRHVLFEEDLDWAESRLRTAFATALERGEERVAAQYGWMLGWSLALRGRPLEAVETMPEFLELEGPWAVLNGGWAAPSYIRALVAAGQRATARQELDRLRARHPAPLFSAEIGLAEVDVLAAEGRRTEASERARRSLETAMTMGAEVRAVSLAWADLLLRGRPAARPVMSLSERSPIALHRAQSAFARSVLSLDRAGGVAAVRRLAELGHRWNAVEAVSCASAAFPSVTGRPQEFRDLYEELTVGRPIIATRATPPRFSGAAAALTKREHEVAVLAAQGLSDRDIAGRLVLSVRTVETHVAHALAKVGLHHREDLSRVL